MSCSIPLLTCCCCGCSIGLLLAYWQRTEVWRDIDRFFNPEQPSSSWTAFLTGTAAENLGISTESYARKLIKRALVQVWLEQHDRFKVLLDDLKRNGQLTTWVLHDELARVLVRKQAACATSAFQKVF
jgi:hypothetical protein